MCKDKYSNCMHLPGYKGEKNGKYSVIDKVVDDVVDGKVIKTKEEKIAELLCEQSYCERSCMDCFGEKKYHGIKMARYLVSKNGNGKGNCECGQEAARLYKVYDRKERITIMRCLTCINGVLRKDGYYIPETPSNLFVFIEELCDSNAQDADICSK